MIKTVIFDMDGLMFDTERMSNDAFYAAEAEMGFKVDPNMLAEMKGVNLAGCTAIMKRYLGEDAPLEYYRSIRRRYFEKMLAEDGLPVKPGLYDLLEYLKHENYTVVLATSTAREGAKRYLDMAGVDQYFDHKVCGDMVKKSKPEPDIFLEAVKLAGDVPENCLVLEDSHQGVEAGYRAGCHVIMVPDCVPANERMRSMADAVVDSLDVVLNMLKEGFGR